MNDIPASARHHALRARAPVAPKDLARRRYSLSTLRNIIATWRQRTRFRWDLKQMARDNPHLIDDIGLTTQQAEEEIAKLPFWQR